MSAKYVKVRKLVVPAISILILTSQLMSCGTVSKDEMATLLEGNKTITIELSKVSSDNTGTSMYDTWNELGLYTDDSEVREAFEKHFNISKEDETGIKYGTAYVDTSGNETGNNSCLMYAMSNNSFRSKLSTVTGENMNIYSAYSDIEADTSNDKIMRCAVNSYFNLFNDYTSENGKSKYNGSKPLNRIEFMSAVVKSFKTYDDLENITSDSDKSWAESITHYCEENDLSIDEEDVMIASIIHDKSFLNVGNSAVNYTNDMYITKGEAAYILANTFFSDEYIRTSNEVIKGDKICNNTCINAGDVAKDKKYDNYEDCNAAVLKYCTENGVVDESIYRAIYTLVNNDVIDSSNDFNWDSALTKDEAINMILKVYQRIYNTSNINVDKVQDEYDSEVAKLPEINGINDGDVFTIYVGESVDILDGVTAYDSIDGDITDRLEISGEYNSDEVGEYELGVSVSDSAGNETKLAVTVGVIKRQEAKSEVSSSNKGASGDSSAENTSDTSNNNSDTGESSELSSNYDYEEILNALSGLGTAANAEYHPLRYGDGDGDLGALSALFK